MGAFQDLAHKMWQRLRRSYVSKFLPIFLLTSLVAALAISGATEDIRFVDALYLAVSAVTCTGLVSVPMIKLTLPSFAIMALLMVFCNQMMITNVYPLVYRWFSLRRLSRSLTLSVHHREAVKRIHDTVTVAIGVMVSFMLFWIILGFALLSGALLLRPNDPTLEIRHFTIDGSALFLSISAFTQGGFTLTANSIQYLRDNPLAYIILGIVILAGSEQTPLLLRWHTILLLRLAQRAGLSSDDAVVSSLQTLLEKGEDYNPYSFPSRKTWRLCAVAAVITFALYFLFLVSSVQRPDSLEEYGAGELLGLGLFQAVSVRFAGFQILNLRRISQGCLVAYAVAMFLKPACAVSFRDAVWIASTKSSPPPAASVPASPTALPLPQPQPETPQQLQQQQQQQPAQTSAKSADTDDEIPRPAGRAPLPERLYGNAARWAETQLQLNTSHANWILLCFFLLAFTEDASCASRLAPCSYNLFFNAFEIVSAYSNAGVSVGLPQYTYSYSGGFTDGGKVIIMFLMLLGKHRGFPSSTALCMDVHSEIVAASLGALPSDAAPGLVGVGVGVGSSSSSSSSSSSRSSSGREARSVRGDSSL